MIESIKKDIDHVFGDTSVPISETRERLEDLKEHIDMLLENLLSD